MTAAQCGVDAIGLVFFRRSPRFVEVGQARKIVRALPPFVTSVALFVDPTVAEVHHVLDAVPVGLLQFHGNETADFCAGFSRPFVKAVRMRRGIDLLAYAADFAGAAGLLVDTYVPGTPGGTGETFDWDLLPPDRSFPLVLSGGLTPENVTAAITHARPWAVDVSSGVEVGKGIKDAEKIAAFVQGVRNADG